MSAVFFATSFSFALTNVEQVSLEEKQFLPTQPFLLPKRFDGSNGNGTGLADWSLISDHKLKIKRIKVLHSKDGEGIGTREWESDSAVIMEMCSTALSNGVRRYALSDFSAERGAFFDNVFAVIVVMSEDGTFIIGVSNMGFYLGVRRGTMHQLFESWLLAQFIDDVMFQETGFRIDEKTLSRMSGEMRIEEQKTFYEQIKKR